jgi:hypothetical protein
VLIGTYYRYQFDDYNQEHKWAFWRDSLDRMTKRVFTNEKMQVFLTDPQIQGHLFEWHMAEIGS